MSKISNKDTIDVIKNLPLYLQKDAEENPLYYAKWFKIVSYHDAVLGECGGKFPESVNLDEYEHRDALLEALTSNMHSDFDSGCVEAYTRLTDIIWNNWPATLKEATVTTNGDLAVEVESN
jgi:hypothetical protein